jgi:two-component system, sensor histidine kinase and response regulator
MMASGHILVAEDNRLTQRVATAMLEHLGLGVDVVGDGAQAVKAATRTPYQAILMDCRLPVLDGYEATAAIRAHEAAGRRTPIIAVTASTLTSERQGCLAADMDDYLAKPVSLKMLTTVLARWVPDGPVRAASGPPSVPLPGARVRPAGPGEPLGPVLDPEVVGRLESLGKSAGEDLMGQLAVLFLADADERVATLRQALAGHDAAALARSGHTLGGASANLGATGLARLCGTLATDGAAPDLVDLGAVVDAVEAELARVRTALGARSSAS